MFEEFVEQFQIGVDSIREDPHLADQSRLLGLFPEFGTVIQLSSLKDFLPALGRLRALSAPGEFSPNSLPRALKSPIVSHSVERSLESFFREEISNLEAKANLTVWSRPDQFEEMKSAKEWERVTWQIRANLRLGQVVECYESRSSSS